MDIKRFLEKLSSDTPTPGGGSASALTGALSASLVLMTAGLSLKKGKMKERELRGINKEVSGIQEGLFRAIEGDAQSYEAVLTAFRLPKSTERERLIRTKAIQKAFRGATVAPQLVCRHSVRLLEYSKILILKGNPNAISDVGVAACLADAALKGGMLNIGINLGPTEDPVFGRRMRSWVGKLEKKRNQLMETIQKKLKESLPI
jgi:formiminotetrahydrofolate cyclodeaminase